MEILHPGGTTIALSQHPHGDNSGAAREIRSISIEPMDETQVRRDVSSQVVPTTLRLPAKTASHGQPRSRLTSARLIRKRVRGSSTTLLLWNRSYRPAKRDIDAAFSQARSLPVWPTSTMFSVAIRQRKGKGSDALCRMIQVGLFSAPVESGSQQNL